jgi:hypothetical protein
VSDDPTPGYYRIPAGTMPKTCRGCEATVYQVMTEQGRKLLSATFDRECVRPTPSQHGVGVDHEEHDCPDAARFADPRAPGPWGNG